MITFLAVSLSTPLVPLLTTTIEDQRPPDEVLSHGLAVLGWYQSVVDAFIFHIVAFALYFYGVQSRFSGSTLFIIKHLHRTQANEASMRTICSWI